MGADRARLLNGLFTADVVDLEAGAGVYGFLTDLQGKVKADSYVSAFEDRLWLELPAGSGSGVREHIELYRVIDDVEVIPLFDMLPLAVAGAGAREMLASLGALPEMDRHLRFRVGATEVELARRRLWGVDLFQIWLPSSIAGELVADLTGETGIGQADVWVGVEALDALRVEAGVGRWGVDFDATSIANETGQVDSAVDFTKGCYLGQEIVARIHYRGRPAHECRAIEIESDSVPKPGSELLSAGEVCGRVTSVIASDEAGRWLAIATLRRDAIEADALDLASGGSATLRVAD
jgi:folate-binding protein YgfZ